MTDLQNDLLSFREISLSFESTERFLMFLVRIEKSELKKVAKGALMSFVNRNWYSLAKDCEYIKELGQFLKSQNMVNVAESLRIECKQQEVKSRVISKFVYDLLELIENCSKLIRDYVMNSSKSKDLPNIREDYELLSYNSVRFKDSNIIKTDAPRVLFNNK